MDIKNDIRALIKGAENAEVEFKSAKGGLPESFWESFSAFANTNGGIIVLGVKEKEGRFLLDGLTEEQVALYKKRFWDCAHNKEKVSATMLTERDVVVGEADGSFYLVFRIPRLHTMSVRFILPATLLAIRISVTMRVTIIVRMMKCAKCLRMPIMQQLHLIIRFCLITV